MYRQATDLVVCIIVDILSVYFGFVPLWSSLLDHSGGSLRSRSLEDLFQKDQCSYFSEYVLQKREQIMFIAKCTNLAVPIKQRISDIVEILWRLVVLVLLQ